MSDRAPIPTIAGLLTGFVGVDVPVAYFANAATLESFYPVVTDAPSGGSVVVALRTATGGGGSGLTATIASGARSPATPTTGSVAIAAGTTLYLRITSESGAALNLSGSYSVSSASGVTTALTTVDRVKRYLDIAAATWDTLLGEIVLGVSGAATRYIGRAIVETTITGERHDGGKELIRLLEYPVASDTSELYDKYAGKGIRFLETSPVSLSTFLVKFTRPVFLYDHESRTEEQLEAFLRRELALRLRNALAATYTVAGHTSDGAVWNIDTIALVDDEWSGIVDALWILSRTFMKDRHGGTQTRLELIQRDSLEFA